MTELAILPLGADHLPSLEKLLRATPEFTPEETVVALEVLEEALASTGANGAPGPDDYVALVAERDTTVLGYACFGRTPMTERSYDLYWIAVDPSAKRAGIGRALIDAVLAALRERAGGVLRVETEGGAKYAATRAFYERIGFEVAGSIRDFYGTDRSLVVFVKYL